MIADIVQRLKDEVRVLKKVEGALSYAAVQVQPPDAVMPAVYVVELTEAFTGARGMSGSKSQDALATIAVILWMSAARLDTATAPGALEDLRTAIKRALFGWSPPDSDGAQFANVAGRLLFAEGKLVVWQQSFSLQREERQ
jgi:hypothetical protein